MRSADVWLQGQALTGSARIVKHVGTEIRKGSRQWPLTLVRDWKLHSRGLIVPRMGQI